MFQREKKLSTIEKVNQKRCIFVAIKTYPYEIKIPGTGGVVKMNFIIEEKKNFIIENWREIDEKLSLREFVTRNAGCDPGFLRWLFDDETIEDFGIGMTEKQKGAYEEYVSSLIEEEEEEEEEEEIVREYNFSMPCDWFGIRRGEIYFTVKVKDEWRFSDEVVPLENNFANHLNCAINGGSIEKLFFNNVFHEGEVLLLKFNKTYYHAVISKADFIADLKNYDWTEDTPIEKDELLEVLKNKINELIKK